MQAHPHVIEQLASAAEERRAQLERSRSTAEARDAERASIAQRMRAFFGLGS